MSENVKGRENGMLMWKTPGLLTSGKDNESMGNINSTYIKKIFPTFSQSQVQCNSKWNHRHALLTERGERKVQETGKKNDKMKIKQCRSKPNQAKREIRVKIQE